MDSFLIKGESSISGEVSVGGAKNSALPVIFSTLLTEEPCKIENVPDLADIKSALSIINHCGKKAYYENGVFFTTEETDINTQAPYDMVRKMRASVLVAGPMLARFGQVKFALPGGCAIGVRPIDLHLKAFESMGANIKFDSGYVLVSAKKLKPCRIKFKFPSVGATENAILAAALTEGETVIDNAAREPEIKDLADIIVKMGAKIEGAGSERIKIYGSKKLKKVTHKIIPDRIEAGTFLILACALGCELTVRNAVKDHLGSLLRKLKISGCELETGEDFIKIKGPKKIRPADISTGPYPLFPTDLQAQWMACMLKSSGEAKLKENIFENRFMHAAELLRMGADISLKHNVARVKGVASLAGAPVMASDLRAGAALLIAAAMAKGESLIKRVYHIDRGYEKIEKKMFSIGIDIKRIKE